VLLPLLLLRLTLLWLLSFRLLRNSRLLWRPSRLDWQLSRLVRQLSRLVRQWSNSRCPRGCSLFQTIQDTLQQQLLADRAEHQAFMTHILQHTGVQIPPVQSAPPPALQMAVVPAIQAGPPLPTVGPSSSPLRPVTLVFLIAGSQLRQHSAASATSSCCYHCCCGSVYDLFGSGSSCCVASVRVSTSSSFCDRSWIRD
jgi:hypothetical protein